MIIKIIERRMKRIPKTSKTYFTAVSIIINVVTLERKISAFFLSISAC